MDRNISTLKKQYLMVMFILVGWMFWPTKAVHHTSSDAGTPHKVYIAFGFHVNLYHSYRGDTNDENGFGQDIRVIRHIIQKLDGFNRKGIPVSAVWDFDNLFSLQEILPGHAPDIISDVQRRVRENRDEVILMSYNNGLVSAMNHQEFMISMQRAISNVHGSGVRDLFGRVVPVVRPQEMMTTPGNFECYKALGIQYMSLYYSATPFDAFRIFSRELTLNEAYNPVLYRHPGTGEQMAIIPTYHPGDLVEHVSLRNWVKKLHRYQNEGKIDRDVLIFLNFDADAEFWAGVDLPWHLKWAPNTGGIGQLVKSIADLDFVSFTKLTDYLESHSPVGTVQFSQDTADGSFHGYHSWAEKAYVSDYWTRIVRNRRAHEMARKTLAATGSDDMPPELRDLLDESFEMRLRALSTTNFGLAGPFLARQREAEMASLLSRLDQYTSRINVNLAAHVETFIKAVPPPSALRGQGRLVEPFLHVDRDTPGAYVGDRHLTLTLPVMDSHGSRYFISDAAGRIIPTVSVKRAGHLDGQRASITLRVSKQHDMPDGLYFLFIHTSSPVAPSTADRPVFANTRVLRNEHIAVHLDANGYILGVTRDGVLKLEEGSLVPYIRFRGNRLSPQKLTVTVEESGENGIASLRIQGQWDGPPKTTRAPGWMNYRLRLISDVPYLLIDGSVRYPDTYRNTVIKPEKPMLARRIDDGWEEVAPVELRFAIRAKKEQPFYIQKRNYMGKEDAYAIDYYRHSQENLNVASINNHITSEYAGVTTGGKGMAVAMNTDVNSNFAFCPFKMVYLPETGEFRIRANPFGTYSGAQILPPTRGNRLGFEAVLLSTPHFQSAGPTYNGYHDRFDLMLAFFDGDSIPDDVKRDLITFARPPVVFGSHLLEKRIERSQTGLPPAGFLALPYEDGILFHWEQTGAPGTEYRIRCMTLPEIEEKSFSVKETTLFVGPADLDTMRSTEGLYVATIEALHTNGQTSKRSPEIRFRLTPTSDQKPKIPNDFKAKILWANISAWIQRNLL